jgi:indolepyruvate ferredoxin oxidoreductase beta subunit
MKKTINVLIVGVGGQGILLTSELLSEAAMEAGYDVKKSEVHGMAQRGGVVSSHVRIGERIYSPLIKEGETDVLLAFEAAEALRWVHFLKTDGTVVLNDLRLIPPIALIKGFKYPDRPVELIKNRMKNVKPIHAVRIAQNLGNIKTWS